MTFAQRSLFVRPNNFHLSTLLQTLSIGSFFSRQSKGKILSFQVPREADQQRILNFCGIQFLDDQTTTRLISSKQTYNVPLLPTSSASRAARDWATLNVEASDRSRNVGLVEIAPLIGLRGMDEEGKKGLEGKGGRQSALLSSPQPQDETRTPDEDGLYISVKAERRASPARRNDSPHRGTLHSPPPRILKRALQDFGGFAGKVFMSC